MEVKWINETRGKGVFARSNISKHDIVWTEEPLISFRNITDRSSVRACSYCLRTILRPEDLNEKLRSLYSKIYPSKPPTLIPCEYCKDHVLCEYYCCEECRTKAWELYHHILCPRTILSSSSINNPMQHQNSENNMSLLNESQNGTKENEIVRTSSISITEHVQQLFATCQRNQKNNPPLILRMFADIIRTIRTKLKMHTVTMSHNNDKYVASNNQNELIEEAFEKYKIFVGDENNAVFLEHHFIDMMKAIFKGDSFVDDVLTVRNYRYLHSVITRNAQTVNPVSDFHLYLNSLSPSQQQQIVSLINSKLTPFEFLANDIMKDLCVMGTALYAVANTLNHSCLPNVMAVCSHNSHRLTLIALRDIIKGEELTISYIDESAPFSERQKQLKEYYKFDCDCKKCLQQL